MNKNHEIEQNIKLDGNHKHISNAKDEDSPNSIEKVDKNYFKDDTESKLDSQITTTVIVRKSIKKQLWVKKQGV